MQEREAKLPWWAREELKTLRDKIDSLMSPYVPEDQLYVELDYSSLRSTPRDLHSPLTNVRFWLNDETERGNSREAYVDVRIERDPDGHPHLYVHANHDLVVVPACANVVKVYGLAFYGRVDTGTQEENDGS